LKDAIKEKCRGKVSRRVSLLHGNAPAHTTVAVQCCGLQQLNHAPYSPDLDPSDYFVFRIEVRFAWKKNTSDEEVISAVLDHFKDKNSEYFFQWYTKVN
jgi:hypothetical protein